MAKRSPRIEYGKHITEWGAKNLNIVVLEGDLKESTQSVQFEKAFPERYFEAGVAEQNMVGMAAGMSLAGKLPIVHSFAAFISMRACEQVRTSVAYPRLNVKFVVTHAGISTGSAGTTHHAVEDIAIMRAIPNMTVLVPGDVEEMRQVVDAALAYDGPVYIRLGAGDAEDVYGPTDRFAIGRATRLREGKDATIITTGTLANEGLMAAEQLSRENNLDVRVVQMACIKPLDEEAIIEAIEETRFLVTVEEHNRLGGLGGAVCEIAAAGGRGRVFRMGIQDRFSGIGSSSVLMAEEGLTVAGIVQNVLKLVNS